MSGRSDKAAVEHVTDVLDRAKGWARGNDAVSVFVVVLNGTHKYAEVNLGGPEPLTKMLGQLAMEQLRLTRSAVDLEDEEEGA